MHILNSILETDNFDYSYTPLKIYFDKDIISNNNNLENASRMVNRDNYNIIVISITNDNFETNIKNELAKIHPKAGDIILENELKIDNNN